MLVAFMYGSVAWGMLPINPRVSWETHLAAAIIGAVMALLMRHRDNPPRKRYSWEEEAEVTVEDDAGETPGDPEIGPPRYLIH
jgi:membrane associated rhomboid family serine protease